jgi:hypothetical protein
MNLGHPVVARKLHEKLALHNRRNRRRDDRRVGVKRVPVCTHATYTYKMGPFIYTVEGLIRNLSATGCSIRATMPQVVGRLTTLTLPLHGNQQSLCVWRNCMGYHRSFWNRISQVEISRIPRTAKAYSHGERVLHLTDTTLVTSNLAYKLTPTDKNATGGPHSKINSIGCRS